MFTAPVGLLSKKDSTPAFDVDAQAYIDALHVYVPDLGGIYEISPGVFLTDLEVQEAINQFFLDLKGLGSTTNNSDVYNSLYYAYPYIGANANAHALNSVNPVASNPAYFITWVGTVTHNADGITSDGSTGYGNTHFVSSTGDTLNSSHMAGYMKLKPSGSAAIVGASNLGSQEHSLFGSSAFYIYRSYSPSIQLIGSPASDGFFIGNRRSATVNRVLNNDVLIGSASTSAGSLPTIDEYISALNENGTATSFQDRAFQFNSHGEGLTDNQETDLYDAVLTLQTTLSRN